MKGLKLQFLRPIIMIVTILLITGLLGGCVQKDDTPIQPSLEVSTISTDEAKAIALEHAKINESDTEYIKVDYDHSQSQNLYDIDFKAGNLIYEYEINAATGTIYNFTKIETASNPSNGTISSEKSTQLSSDEAKRLAYKNASVVPEQVISMECKLERDDGVEYYDVDFITKLAKYEYKVNAISGEIISRSEKAFAVTSRREASSAINNSDIISAESAKEIAINHAKADTSTVKFLKVELDDISISPEYEIEFLHNNIKYDYEIDATSGKITSYSQDTKGNNTTSSATSSKITLEQAKSIALADKGFKSNDVTYTKSELDHDNNVEQYEIEFYTQTSKYEYEINAATGQIISSDFEAHTPM